MQDAGVGKCPDGREVVVRSEVPEAVGDEMTLVELHATQRVRAARNDKVSAVVDGGLGEGLRIAAVLADVVLGLTGDVVGRFPSAPECM